MQIRGARECEYSLRFGLRRYSRLGTKLPDERFEKPTPSR